MFECLQAICINALTKFKDININLTVLNDIESGLLAVKILARITSKDKIFTHPGGNEKKYWVTRADKLLKCVDLFRILGKPVTTVECLKVIPSALTGKPWRLH